MSDIVEILRERSRGLDHLQMEAADEIERLRAALAAEPEPVAEVCADWALRWVGSEPIADLLARHPGVRIGTKLYAAPPQRQPLSDAKIEAIRNAMQACFTWGDFARAVEAMHGIKPNPAPSK